MQLRINRYTILVPLFLFLVSLLGLTACGGAQPGATSTTTPAASAEPVTLKVAVLPILDALPMFVAQQEGLFEKNGVRVEFIPAASAAERDQIFASGQVDAMINDAISTLFYNKDQTQIQIVRFARVATPEKAQYTILASSQSGITSVEGLKGVEIGISQGTVIEYVTDRLLQAEGLLPEEIKTIAIPKINERMTLLTSGDLKAATLPDPSSSLAIQQGARVIVEDSQHPEYGYSVYSLRKQWIDQHPQAVRGFLLALEQATQAVNADPKKYDSLLSTEKLVPESLVGTYELPVYPTASILTQAQWDDVLAWAKQKGLIQQDVSYSQSVNASFLP